MIQWAQQEGEGEENQLVLVVAVVEADLIPVPAWVGPTPVLAWAATPVLAWVAEATPVWAGAQVAIPLQALPLLLRLIPRAVQAPNKPLEGAD